jgi:hypothetical protein
VSRQILPILPFSGFSANIFFGRVVDYTGKKADKPEKRQNKPEKRQNMVL